MAWTNAGKVAIVPKGEHSTSNAYERLDLVTSNNTMYIAKQDVPTGIALNNTTYWQETITGQSTPIATTSVAGSVMPDGESIKIKSALTGLIGTAIKDLGYIDMEDAQVSLHTYFESDTLVMFTCQEAGAWGQEGIIMSNATRSQLTTDDQGDSRILFVLFPSSEYHSRTALAFIEGFGVTWRTALLMEDRRGDNTWSYVNLWSSIDVDSALSTTSTNPVQNQVITNALDGKASKISPAPPSGYVLQSTAGGGFNIVSGVLASSLLTTSNSAKVVISSTAPSDTTALWVK